MMEYGSQDYIPIGFARDEKYREMVERHLQMTLLAEMREHLFEEGMHTVSIRRIEEKDKQGVIIIIYRSEIIGNAKGP